jgi:hypothetical protein
MRSMIKRIFIQRRSQYRPVRPEPLPRMRYV